MFTPYEKIPEGSGKWGLEEGVWRRLRRVSWVVTEKVHGANFAFLSDGTGAVYGANRRHVLREDEAFFGWQALRDAYVGAVREVVALVRASHPKIERVTIYGELFGGGYPHPEVTPVAGVQPVQTGVWYAPDLHFCAFDIAVEDGKGVRHYLAYEEALSLFKRAGLFAAKPLFVGTYEQAMEQPIRFDSTLPRLLGLPSLPAGSNLAEGVVIKPYQEVAGLAIRPIVKRKIPEFAEDRRYHEAEKWQEPSSVANGGALDMLKWEAYCHLTENRLNAARSKVGEAEGQTLFLVFVEDIQAELRETQGQLLAGLTVAQQAELETYIKVEAGKLIPG